MLTTSEARAAVVSEGMSWMRTPFHLGAQLKGIGVDCTSFILACYGAAGIALEISPQPVKKDWFQHREDDRIIAPVRAHAHEVQSGLPGDLVLFKIGMSWAHAAVVREWPILIHAKWYSGVQLIDVTQFELRKLPRLIFSPWPEEEKPEAQG